MGVKLIHLLIHTQSHVEADPRASVAHHRSVHVRDVELAELHTIRRLDAAGRTLRPQITALNLELQRESVAGPSARVDPAWLKTVAELGRDRRIIVQSDLREAEELVGERAVPPRHRSGKQKEASCELGRQRDIRQLGPLVSSGADAPSDAMPRRWRRRVPRREAAREN